MHFRAYDKIRKKSAINQETSESLEKKLEKEKDFSKWNEILSLPFEVTTIRFTEKLRIPKIQISIFTSLHLITSRITIHRSCRKSS